MFEGLAQIKFSVICRSPTYFEGLKIVLQTPSNKKTIPARHVAMAPSDMEKNTRVADSAERTERTVRWLTERERQSEETILQKTMATQDD